MTTPSIDITLAALMLAMSGDDVDVPAHPAVKIIEQGDDDNV